MKSTSTFEISLLTNKNKVMLPTLINKSNLMGLSYKRRQIENVVSNEKRIVLTLNGELLCSKRKLLFTLVAVPDVIKVERIKINNRVWR